MTITTKLFIWMSGKPVGEDQFGNQYYIKKKPPKGEREKRWVRYANASFLGELLGGGLPDASRVPAEWHGWLHHTTNILPSKRTAVHHAWEKPHEPNLTGTKAAYLPPGHLLAGGERAAAASDYEAWRP